MEAEGEDLTPEDDESTSEKDEGPSEKDQLITGLERLVCSEKDCLAAIRLVAAALKETGVKAKIVLREDHFYHSEKDGSASVTMEHRIFLDGKQLFAEWWCEWEGSWDQSEIQAGKIIWRVEKRGGPSQKKQAVLDGLGLKDDVLLYWLQPAYDPNGKAIDGSDEDEEDEDEGDEENGHDHSRDVVPLDED